MLIKIIKNKKGVTLLELVVAVSLFVVIMLATMSIFKLIIEGQRNAIVSRNIQETMRYALEVMAKEIRMAQKKNNCTIGMGSNQLYKVTGNNLQFENIKGQCVVYSKVTDAGLRWRLEIDRDGAKGYITPKSIEVSDIVFDIVDYTPNSQQGRITIKMTIMATGGKDMHKTETKMQTTISSRFYE